MRVGNISAMIAGCAAYMSAWKTRPSAMASQMANGFAVSIIGKAKNAHVAPRIAPAARWLGVASDYHATELAVETAPLERMQADLLEVSIPPGSLLAGVHIDELRLPPGAVVTLVLREGAGFWNQRNHRDAPPGRVDGD